MKRTHVPVVALCLGLGGCASQVPVATTYPVTFQKKMQAAEHWDILAADVANRLFETLGGADGQQRRASALYVQRPPFESDFGEAFHDLLLTHLLAQGFAVSESPAKGLPVKYHIQLVAHNDRGFIRPKPGTFTTLAGGIAVVHDAADHSATAATMLGAVGLDVVSGFISDQPDHEVIVTTSVMSGDRYIARLRDIYYISDNNALQYMAKVPTRIEMRPLEVVGP